METMAEWAEAARRVSGFLAGCRDYGQSAEFAADLAVLRTYGVVQHPAWRCRFVSAEQALGAMRQFEAAAEAERIRLGQEFLEAHRYQPLLKRGEGIPIRVGHFGRSDPAERARREANRADRAAENRAAAKGFGCGKKAGAGNGKRRAT